MEYVYYSHMSYPNYRYSIIERLKSKAIHRDNGCIEYAGGDLKHKYGLVSITVDRIRKSVPAHRAMYMAVNDCLGLPSNIHIRHKCDNPPCMNIEHLIAGSPADNTQDCIERKRRATKYKLHTRQCIVTDETIRAIRAEPKGIKQWYIAEKYGISIGYVSKIRCRNAKTLV